MGKESGVRVLGKEFHIRSSRLGNQVTACLMTVLARTHRRYGEDLPQDSEPIDTRSSLASAVRCGECAILRTARMYVLSNLAPKALSGRRMTVGRRPDRKRKASAL